MPRGGGVSPLVEHGEFLLALIDEQPDLTPDEVVCAMREHEVPGKPHGGLAVLSAPQDHV
jgi:hypothetical protein